MIAAVKQASAMSSLSSAPASSDPSDTQCEAEPVAKRDSQRMAMLAGKRTVNGHTYVRT